MILSAPCPSKRSHQRYERHLGGCPALATPQTRDAPQTPVSQGKREILRERPGQLSHLPPPSVGIAPPHQGGLTYSRAGGEQQGGHAA